LKIDFEGVLPGPIRGVPAGALFRVPTTEGGPRLKKYLRVCY